MDALRRIRDTKPQPNIIVESGTGLHLYWLVELREVSKERLERLLRVIAEKLDGDSGAARAGRLMRVGSARHILIPHGPQKIDLSGGHLLDILSRAVAAIGHHLLRLFLQPLFQAIDCWQYPNPKRFSKSTKVYFPHDAGPLAHAKTPTESP